MTTITEFINARITEAEEVARSVPEVTPKSTSAVFTSLNAPTGTVEMSPAQVLADCRAKRLLMEISATWIAQAEQHATGRDVVSVSLKSQAIAGESVLRNLAATWADHPDYETWRP